ncbi:hypothetical protein OG500_09590 [Kitasatospora sp. NBC_01250]|uniref:hypothetical protein n=1 Tax=unclassified Kitasatospora TaxID=2633591 RepID=UPI002E10BB5D|nr:MULTISPECIES: hypothetical protein [unclassified Kitasatospora]WSJ66420.1 hypothetical protein OG294_09950 [Kitasatospora sp. NBC_01302]
MSSTDQVMADRVAADRAMADRRADGHVADDRVPDDRVRAEEPGSPVVRRLTGHLAARCLGVALVVSGTVPLALGTKGGLGIALWLSVVGAGFAWWAAPPVPEDAAQPRLRLFRQLSRHRNTVLAAVALLLAAMAPAAAWLAAASTVLVLTYLLYVDTFSDVHRPPGRTTLAVAYLASGVVLLAALVPTGHSSAARLLAALGVAVAAGAVGLTLYERR